MDKTLIQTIKPRLAVLDIDPKWRHETISNRLANIRLIPNRATRVIPFKTQFGQKPNSEFLDKLTEPSSKNLLYNKLKTRCLDKEPLRHDALKHEDMAPQRHIRRLDSQYSNSSHQTVTPPGIDSNVSESMSLVQNSPSKITPSGRRIDFVNSCYT